MSVVLGNQNPSTGELRHRITIEYNASVGTIDSNGVPIESWTTLHTLWAKKVGLKASQFIQAAAVQAERECAFVIRYRAGIKAGMRIIEGTEIYEITSPPIDSEGRKAWLEIHAREVLLNGG